MYLGTCWVHTWHYAADPLILAITVVLLKAGACVVLLCRQHMPSSALPQALCYEELLAAQQQLLPSFSWEPVSEHDPCGLCYTSGTTGNPKVSAWVAGLLECPSIRL